MQSLTQHAVPTDAPGRYEPAGFVPAGDEPVGSEPVGSELVGSELVGSEPVGATPPVAAKPGPPGSAPSDGSAAASGSAKPPESPSERGARGDGLDARLAAVKDEMDARLALAAVAYEVNTAHIETPPVDWTRIGAPPAPAALPLTTLPGPDADTTPVAALLHRASLRLRTDGWCAGTLTDEYGSLCSQGAIRKESAGDRDLEAQAMTVLLEAIRRRFGPHVESVPSFNDSWGTGREPTRMLEQASVLADSRGI
ncbi:DUF6197 family protein [Streptomyces aureus]|uniref:DUF6197 family protein n=1 Tax=Streptomyces aureus TaxID=193461 RepID=UPI0033DB841E